MANTTPGIVSRSTFPQCIQTHTNTRVVYSFSSFFNANRNTGGALNIKELNTTITPRLPTSKILVSISLSYDQLYYGAWYLIRRVGGVATEIGSAPPSGNNQPYGFAAPMWQNDGDGIISKKACRSFLDTPNTTLPVTYELWVYSTETTHNFFILNGTYNNSDNSINGRGTSQMTLQEFFK